MPDTPTTRHDRAPPLPGEPRPTSGLGAALSKLLWLLAEPVRRTRAQGSVVIGTYRGYASSEALFLIGRVLHQPIDHTAGDSSPTANLWHVFRRLRRRGVSGARLIASIDGQRQGLITDRDGYFNLRMRLRTPLGPQAATARVHLQLIEPATAEAVGEVLVAPRQCRFMVISDIDDTVLATGVANKTRMIARMLFKSAESRVAFAGVAEFYRQLHDGCRGHEHNPLLYVSRGPWVIYETLQAFFELHRFPERPVLFLREWGLRFRPPFIRRDLDSKIETINELLAVSPDLPVVLIGDSGQHDPELYRDVARSWPGRVRLVLIRDVTGGRRDAAVAALARELAASGTPCVVARTSKEMAEAAAAADLIAPTRELPTARPATAAAAADGR